MFLKCFEVGGTSSMFGVQDRCMFSGKLCVTKLRDMSSSKQEDNVKMYLGAVGYENCSEPLGFMRTRNWL